MHRSPVRPRFAPPPTQSTRRNTELILILCAIAITTISLVLVEASQEQTITWDLAKYGLTYAAVFVVAHLAVRRYAPYADPLLLPIVALLNGLGLVLIHRLDLADAENAVYQGLPIPSRTRTSRCCGRLWPSAASSRC